MKKFFSKRKVKDFIMLNIGIIMTAFCLVLVFEPNGAVFGGVAGLGIVLHNYIDIPVSTIILVINILLLVVAWIFIGKEFCIKTIYGSLAYPLYAFIFELLLKLVDQKVIVELYQTNGLLLVFFSAIIMGIGLGLAIKAGASTGGVDIIQALFYKYLKIPYSKSLIFVETPIILLGSIINFSGSAAILNALYAVAFIILSGYIMDSIIFSGFNVRATYIITNRPEEIKQEIFDKLDRGVTEIYTKGGYTGVDRKMLLCVLSSREFFILKDIIESIDPLAFIYAVRASEVHGEGFSYDANKGN